MKTTTKKNKDITHTRSAADWQRYGEKAALRLFRDSAKSVPAYKKFLAKHRINPELIKTIQDFQQVPTITKENYLKAYPLNELLPHGNLSTAHVISTSSGSTGVPLFWPRGEKQVAEAALVHEQFLTEFFHIDKKRTLFINTFALGMWVAGTTTYDSIMRIAEKYHMTMITPGINLDHILSVVESLGCHYDQLVIAGYPPFVKDVIDAGSERGIKWKNIPVRFLFAAESFSELWREHMLGQVKSENPFLDSLNIYGTADALIVAHETPVSILVRKLANKNAALHHALFGGDHRVPTFAQYNPEIRFFEELPNSKIIFTAASGIPLVRYDIGDTGNIFHLNHVIDLAREAGVDMAKEIDAHNLGKHVWNYPFITIYGRDRMTASLYGLKIYPEHVRGALEHRSNTKNFTGRFVMSTKTNRAENQYLEISVELKSKASISKGLAQPLGEFITKHLCTVNSEYKRLYEALGTRAIPKIVLHPYQTSALFSRLGKQKWKE